MHSVMAGLVRDSGSGWHAQTTGDQNQACKNLRVVEGLAGSASMNMSIGRISVVLVLPLRELKQASGWNRGVRYTFGLLLLGTICLYPDTVCLSWLQPMCCLKTAPCKMHCGRWLLKPV